MNRSDKKGTTDGLILLILRIDKVGDAQAQEQEHEKAEEDGIKVNCHLY